MEKVQKVYFSDVSIAPLPRHFVLQVENIVPSSIRFFTFEFSADITKCVLSSADQLF